MVFSIGTASTLAVGYILKRLEICSAFFPQRPLVIQSHRVVDVLSALAARW
jgi:hypothetical protein